MAIIPEAWRKKYKESSLATKYGLFSGAMTVFETGLSSMANHSAAKAAAMAYRTNARLALLQGVQQQGYLNEQLGTQMWEVMSERDAFLGQQNAALAFSGFADVSTGDKRLTEHTKREFADYLSGMNRTAALQSFEIWKSSMLEANRLEYAAKRQDLIAKQNSGLSAALNVFTSGALNGLGAYAGAKTVSLGNGRDVSVVSED